MRSHQDVVQPSPQSERPNSLEWQLHCPECGTNAVERQGFEGDHGAVTVHQDRDEYSSPIGTRGGYVDIALECGYGHAFRLVVANHKGFEFIGTVR